MELCSVDEKAIITKDGRRVGVLAGSTIDTEEWHVISIMVRLPRDVAKELGIKTKLFKATVISINTDLIGVVGDVIQLKLTLKELDEKF